MSCPSRRKGVTRMLRAGDCWDRQPLQRQLHHVRLAAVPWGSHPDSTLDCAKRGELIFPPIRNLSGDHWSR
jgi:hypothetical protein